jgi:archaellum biogenesis ATPase FlaH
MNIANPVTSTLAPATISPVKIIGKAIAEIYVYGTHPGIPSPGDAKFSHWTKEEFVGALDLFGIPFDHLTEKYGFTCPTDPSLKYPGEGLTTNWVRFLEDFITPLAGFTAESGVKMTESEITAIAYRLAHNVTSELTGLSYLEMLRPLFPGDDKTWRWNVVVPFKRELKSNSAPGAELNGDRRSLDDEDPKKISALITLECHHYNAEPDTMTKAVILQRACAKYRVKREDFIAKALEIAGNVSKPQAKAYKLGDFLALESGGGQFLFPGLVPLTGLGLVAGEAGAGKTTLALDMAGALIFGEEFLGVTPTKTGPVLLISSDEQHGDTQPKLINRGLANAPEDQLIPVLGWDVSQMGFLDELMDTHRPPFVIIDSLRKIHLDPNFDENSSNAVHTLTQLENLAAKYCSFIFLIHHTNKSKDNKGVNKLRGSTAIAASCSAVYLLEGDQSTKTKKFSTPKIRNCEPVDLVLEMDGYNGKFNVVGDGVIDGVTKSNGDRLTEYFQTRPDTWLSGAELKDLFPDMGRSIYRALTSLVQRGTLRERPAKTGRGKVWCINQPTLVNTGNPLPPMPDSDVVDLTNETIDIQEIEASQRLVNAKSTLSQHPENIDTPLTNETIDIQEIDASQRQTTPEGRGGYVDSVDLDPVPPISTVENGDHCHQTTDTAIANDAPISEEDWPLAKAINDEQLRELGWDTDTARQHLANRYGVNSRRDLPQPQFWEWVNYCGELLLTAE